MTEQRELYEFAAATTDVPWADAEAKGWVNCAEAGGWLRQLPDTAVLIEDGFDKAVERTARCYWSHTLMPIPVEGYPLAPSWEELTEANRERLRVEVRPWVAAAAGKE